MLYIREAEKEVVKIKLSKLLMYSFSLCLHISITLSLRRDLETIPVQFSLLAINLLDCPFRLLMLINYYQ
jgi:hypothetical protein